MGIRQIEIIGYRSISHLKMNIQQITAFIGQNGSGKSNILSAIQYFYHNLTEVWEEDGIFDANNSFRNEVRIRIQYDVSNILKIVNHNQNENHSNYETYYKKIKAVFREDIIEIELIKYKGKKTQWNVEYNIRQIIAALFTIYYIDAREISLTDWTELWELIGDLVKLRYEDMDNVQTQIIDLFMQDNSMKLEKLSEVFEKNRINVKTMTAKELGRSFSEIIFKGQIFQYDDRRLKEYSNGTNAFNYTLFLIDILSLIKIYKLKEPIVVIDEPEISLHMEMVDRLMEAVFESVGKIQYFMSTHSARCVKALMESEEIQYDIYHTALKKGYTQLKKVRKLGEREGRERIIATEAYMNGCFAGMIIHVEGASELEVFKNRYLKKVFPVLKKIEVITGMSNRVVYNLTAPDRRNYQTPSLSIVDLDQRLKRKKRDKNKYRFSFIELKDYPVQKEHYCYGRKRKDTICLRNRIKRMGDRCNFFYHLPFFSCEDTNFNEMKALIHQYCMNYHMFTWDTTIEGALITEKNLEVFLKFMEQFFMKQNKQQKYKMVKDVMDKYHFTKNDRLNYLRLVFSGKSDFLMTGKQIQCENVSLNTDISKTFSLVGKTSGWISEWIQFYFEENVNDFQNTDIKTLQNLVKEDFSELYQLMKEIEKN